MGCPAASFLELQGACAGRVGDGITFSSTKSFKTLPAPGDNVSTKIAITADIGLLRAPPPNLLGPESAAEHRDATY